MNQNNNSSYQTDLITLFNNIHSNLDKPEYIDGIIRDTMNKAIVDTNVLVHMMNPSSVIKHKLNEWEKFMRYVTRVFIYKYDEEYALKLMKTGGEDKLWY